jgi:hypothetical protein
VHIPAAWTQGPENIEKAKEGRSLFSIELPGAASSEA